MRKNDKLFNQIKGRILHSTSIEGYRGIKQSGAILPNTGQFTFSFPQSSNSCCFNVAAISLLDLRNPRKPLVGPEGWHNWTAFLNNHSPITVLLEINPNALSESLVTFEELYERFPYQTMVVEAEVCYPALIPFDGITRLILVSASTPTFLRVIHGNNISDSEFSNVQASFEKQLKKYAKQPPWADVLNFNFE